MNTDDISRALEAYKDLLSPDDYLRLERHKGLWEIQNRCRVKAAVESDHSLPNLDEAEQWYWQEKPLLALAPVNVDADLFIETLGEIAAYLQEHGGLAKEVATCLQSFDWRALVEQTDVSLLGSTPFAYVEDFCARAHEMSNNELMGVLSSLVVGLAVRPMLEPASSALITTLVERVKEGGLSNTKPLRCPFCGGAAVVACVGETMASQGEGRRLYCNICSATWEFERIRCGRCGSCNQGKLHYLHIKGDEAHRLHTCDECGSYLRTVFVEHLNAPFVFEVEDLVMLPLDHIAREEGYRSLQ
ncbi:MAG: formate dehydrogenase accessory protein FdhE [Coriobacteriia bacterium]|nr:formate dehydrogenase accessory protein FdhE [Coriobacteriia bacterium]